MADSRGASRAAAAVELAERQQEGRLVRVEVRWGLCNLKFTGLTQNFSVDPAV